MEGHVDGSGQQHSHPEMHWKGEGGGWTWREGGGGLTLFGNGTCSAGQSSLKRNITA